MEKTVVLGNCFRPSSPKGKRNRVFSILARARQGEQAHSRLAVGQMGIGLTGILAVAPAWAAQEIQQKASELQASLPSPDESTGGGVFDLFADNPVLLGGIVLLAAVPFLFSFIQGGSLGVKQINATAAVEGLTSDPTTVLVDIRNKTEIKEQGAPNLAATKRKAIFLPFTQVVQGEVETRENFAESFSKLKQIKAESSVILLDSFGKEAPKAAKLLATVVDRVYYVRGGAVGPSGWKESGEAWKEPGQSPFTGFSLDNIAEDFKAQPTVAKAGIAAGALGLAGAVLFQEVGTAIELAAVAAAGAVFVPRLAGSSGSSTLPDASSETTKKQIKDFVKESSKDPAKAAGKAEQQAEQTVSKAADNTKAAVSDAASEVQSIADSGEGPSGASKAAQTQDKAGKKVEAAADTVQEKATDAAQAAQDSAEEAKEWIEDWRKEQKK